MGEVDAGKSGRLPNFLIIGAMKAGTTSLYHYLREHPQVYTPPYKAPEFFAGQAHFRRGLDWYRGLFAAAPSHALAVGEASNVYTKFPTYTDVPRRIAEHIPQARLVYVVRDPIARIRSHYQHRVTEGREKAPFDEAVFANSIYVDYSRYGLQLEQYEAFFPADQILVITSEALREDRAATVRRVYDFLGVDASFVPPSLDREFWQTKDRASRSVVPPGMRRWIKQRFPAAKRLKELEANFMSGIRRVTGRRESESASTGATGRHADAAAPGAPTSNGHGSSAQGSNGNGSNGARVARGLVVAPETRDRLAALLAGDIRHLRAYLGEEFDGWGLA